MNINTRRALLARGWAGAIALLAVLAVSTPSQASPIPFSVSGSFDMTGGAVDLGGEPDVMSDNRILLGSLHVDGIPNAADHTPFAVVFSFDGLPDIEVRGVIPTIGYNPDQPVQSVLVSTRATPDQLNHYPYLFQQLVAHGDWLHTTSFRSDLPDMEVALSVHPEDPGDIRPVPEPSTALIVAAAFAGLAWKARRRGDERSCGIA